MEPMKTPEELYGEQQMFAAMLKDCCRLSMWCLGLDGQLLDTTCPEAKEYLIFLRIGKCLDSIYADINHNERPIILEDAIGMLWCVDFLRDLENPAATSCLIVLGPVFDAASSLSAVEESIHRLNLSVKLSILVTEKLKQVPVLSLNNLYQFILMHHRILTGETICSSDVLYQRSPKPACTADEEDDTLPFNAERALATEERLLQLIREGSPEFGSIAGPLIENCPQETASLPNILRQRQDTVIIFTALAARAAKEGGVAPRTVLEMRRHYIQEIEKCRTLAELVQLNQKMVDDFVRQVRRTQEKQNMSRIVRTCCDYIRLHLTRPFSLEQMSRELGYEKYYLSKKFSSETGQKVSAYVRYARLERARVMLINSGESIQQISETLQFNSRNYFTKVFAEAYGVTPMAYREQYGVKSDEKETQS